MRKITDKHHRFLPISLSVFWLFLGLLLHTLPATSETAEGDAEIIAMVNHVSIDKSELDRLIDQFKQRTGKESITLNEKKLLLKHLTIRHMILQSPIVQALKKEEYVIKKVAEFENSLVITRFINEHVERQIILTKGELTRYYQDHKSRFISTMKIDASVILLRTQTDAAMVLEKLKTGEPFQGLAKQYSIDLPSAKKGGSLGPIKMGSVYPEVWEALTGLTPGGISQIIETEYGYNILRANKIFTPEVKPFQEVKSEIRDAVVRDKREKAYDEMVNELEKNADLKIFESHLAETEPRQ
ncbi:MAG: peptidylprolyl isomerase [Desulfobacterium sp.]|nr:peptidylprolyl isomerase [Desulfobacterium sp.]